MLALLEDHFLSVSVEGDTLVLYDWFWVLVCFSFDKGLQSHHGPPPAHYLAGANLELLIFLPSHPEC